MRGYSSLHPVTLLIHYTAVLSISMFINNPVILILSLIGAWLLILINDRWHFIRNLLYDIILFLIISAANPLFSHRGKTILFFLNGRPITLEASIYGILMAVMFLSVLNWCKSFTKIMSSEKLLYLFGKLSPNLSLVLSMALRYIPQFQHQATKINNTQTAMGLYSKDDYMDKVKGRMRVFSIVLTWSLENAIDTADSMRARGYGIGKRSQFSIFRMRMEDLLFLLVVVALYGIIILGSFLGLTEFNYYPKLSTVSSSPGAIMMYISYGLLVMLPSVKEMKEKLKWIYYKSRI